MTNPRRSVIYLVGFGVALLPTATYAQPVQYDVPASPLAVALTEFAEEARLSISYSGLDLTGVLSKGTRGHVSRETSLKSILAGTGFGYRMVGDDTVQIYRLPEGKPKAAAPVQPLQRSLQTPEVIEDLVVTAAKRPSRSFELPASVSAISSLVLEDLGAFDLQALAPHIAGFSTTNLGPGRNKIFVRGLSDGPFADRTQAMVGVYIDDTPVNLNDTNPDIRLFDAERVELVRGPQGTLYGAGVLGGLYRIVTNKPDLSETSARVRLTGSSTRDGGLNGLLDAVFNLPIVRDKLGFRVSGYADVRDGYIDQVEQGETNTNDLEIYGVRPSLRWRAGDNWTVDLAGTFQSIRYDDSQYFVEDLGRNKRDSITREPYGDDFYQASLTLKGTLGPVKLTSATAYIDRTIAEVTDATDALPGIDDPAELVPGIFVRDDINQFSGTGEFLDLFGSDAVVYVTQNAYETISHETRLQSNVGGTFEWVAGLYYMNRRQQMDSALLLAFVDRDLEIALTENRIETTKDLALFGELIYRMSDRFSVTGGARISRNSLALEYGSTFALSGEVQATGGKKETVKVIPKLAMQYEWSDDLLTYAQMAAGYRVGGLNINTPLDALVAADPDEPVEDNFVDAFRSDDLVNYEVGVKSYWMDRRIGFNASVFYVLWYDIQSDQIGPSGLPFVTNVGNARSLGYEVELSVNPIPGLELRGTYFWNDSKLTEDNTFLGAFKGDRLPAIAERTFSISGLYQFDLNRDWTATVAADYAYTGESALSFAEDSSPVMGNYGMLNARFQVSNGVWKMGLFAQNITDTFANTFSFGNGFTVTEGKQVTPPRPRTVGVFLERSF
ncbi:MAG: TonB-dependent receptor [Alphaproteobacteria bacterium]|nr:TonB-dependent receptor [Alphaproteobacteria bacterium]